MENPFLELTQRMSAIEEKLGMLVNLQSKASQPIQSKKLVYGLAGLARLLNCSNPTAQRLKNSGKIPYTQAGRKIVFDSDAVLTALNKNGGTQK